MRTLPPLKAISHALKSVIAYRMQGIQIAALWVMILFVADVARRLLFDSANGAANAAELISRILGFVAFSSVAVNWHRFILRDELPPLAKSLRLDKVVMRYLGNSLLILLAGGVPFVLIYVAVVSAPPPTAVVMPLAAILAGALITMLSLKLPALALGIASFTFGDALKSAEGNFWRIAMVFLLNAVIVVVPLVALAILVELIEQSSPVSAAATGLLLSIPLNLFFTLFSVNVLTSLYGFFVEKRDF